MKSGLSRFYGIVATVLILAVSATAMGPDTINFQGKISVDGEPFTGEGLFRFAIVDGVSAPWTAQYWSNDGSDPPVADIPVTVTNGLYSVLLGEAPQQPIPASVFNNVELYLAIWFDDGETGVQHLEPNQTISAVGYAFRAKIADNAETFNDLDSSQFLRNDQDGTLDGNLEILGTVGIGTAPSAEALDVQGNVRASSLIAPEIKASTDNSIATVDFDTLPGNAQNSGITIGKARAMAGQNNGQPYLWLRGNGAHSWILDHTSPGTAWAQSMGAYYNDVKQGNIGFLGIGPTVDYLSIGFNGYAWWNEESKFIVWKTGRAQFMPPSTGSLSLDEPPAWLVLAPGSSDPSGAPLMFRTGALLDTPVAGAMEWDGDHLYITDNTSTRRALAFGGSSYTAGDEASDGTAGATGSQIIVTGITQDPVTKDITVTTKTIVFKNGLITSVE